jgi:hypothetical protein
MSGLRGNVSGNSNFLLTSAPLTPGDERLVNTLSINSSQIKNLTAGANVSFSSDNDSVTINAGVVPGNLVNYVTTVLGTTGLPLISPSGTLNDVKMRALKSGVNTTLSVNGTEDLVINSQNFTTTDAAGITGQSLLSLTSTATDTKLKGLKGGINNTVSTVGQDLVIDSTYTIGNATGILGQSLLSSTSTVGNTRLKGLRANAGSDLSVSTIGQDLVITSTPYQFNQAPGGTGESIKSTASTSNNFLTKSIRGTGSISTFTSGEDLYIQNTLWNPYNLIYIDVNSGSSIEDGTYNGPFRNLEAAVTYLNSQGKGFYMFIFNRGDYNLPFVWDYPMYDGFSGINLSIRTAVNGDVKISSDINFITQSGFNSKFSIDSIEFMGNVDFNFTAQSSEINNCIFNNVYMNFMQFTGITDLNNPSKIEFNNSDMKDINIITNKIVLNNCNLIGGINLFNPESRIHINECIVNNGLMTLTSGAVGYISNLISTTNSTWLLSGDSNLNLIYSDVDSASISVLVGDLTSAKIIIQKKLLAGTNITLTEDAQGITTIDASSGSSSYTPVSSVYLDNSFTGVSDGTIFSPWKTIPDAMTHINSLPNGEYTLFIASTGVVYGLGGIGQTWEISGHQISAVATSGNVILNYDFSFNGAFSGTSRVSFSGITFIGSNSLTIGNILSVYSIIFDNCYISSTQISPLTSSFGQFSYNNCTFGSNTTFINPGTSVLNNCLILGLLTVQGSTLVLNGCKFDLDGTIQLNSSGIIRILNLESVITSATFLVESMDLTANRAYIDDTSAWTIQNSSVGFGGLGLGTFFQISCIARNSFSSGSGITLSTNPSTGVTQITSSFAYVPQINDLSDGYHVSDAIALGFRPFTGANYLNNLFITNTAPLNITPSSSNNVVIGSSSLTNVTDGFRNVNVGQANGGTLTTGFGNIFLGFNNDVSIGTAQNRIILGTNLTSTINNSIVTNTSLANQAGSGQSILSHSSGTGQIGRLADGTVGQVLSTNGSGTLSWTTVSAGATGINGLSDAYKSGSAIALGFKPSIPGNYLNNIFLTNDNPSSITATAIRNIAIGGNCMPNLTTGINNVSVGESSLATITTGLSNTAIGRGAGNGITTGNNNVLLGLNASVSDPNANLRISIGQNVTNYIDSSIFTMTVLANQAGSFQGVLTHSSATGQIGRIPDGSASQVLTTDGAGTLSWTTPSGGASDINSLTDGRKDSVNKILNLGFKGTTSGVNQIWITPNVQPVGMTNAAIGNIVITSAIDSMQDITTASSNLCISGGSSLRNLITGTGNTALNVGSLRDALGDYNTGVGVDAGKFLTTGLWNTFVGAGCSPPSGATNTTGSIMLGSNSFLGSTNNDEQIVIGYNLTGCGITRSLTMASNLAVQAGSGNRVMTLSTSTGQVGPINDGTSGQVLTTNGSGSLSWTTVSGGGGTVIAVQKYDTAVAFTYTPTAGMKYVIIELLGGGGGGGGSASNGIGQASAGGGGGGGAYAKILLTAAQVGVSIAGVVGNRGTGQSGSNDGNDGQNTTLSVTGGTWTLGGGKGGKGSPAGTRTETQKSLGGTVFSGFGYIIYTSEGQGGENGCSVGTTFAFGGKGGDSMLGDGGIPVKCTQSGSSTSLQFASGMGAGGAGAASYENGTNFTGGNGTTGIAIFTEFI